jgi:putative hemolysin
MQGQGRDRNLQREIAEEASLYCKQKTYYLRQRKTTQGNKLVDYF